MTGDRRAGTSCVVLHCTLNQPFRCCCCCVQGAAWDGIAGCLVEPPPGVTFTSMPLLWLRATAEARAQVSS